jgi:hypothetical protein
MNIPRQLGTFEVEEAREIRKRVLGSGTYYGIGSPPKGSTNADRYYAVLQETLYAATDPLTGYTQAAVQVLKYVDGNSLDMEEVTGVENEITVTNRSVDLSADAGILVIIQKIQAEWAVIWADCPNPSSSSSTVTPPP